MNGLLPYKFVWEEVSYILYGADTLLYDPLALCDCVREKGTFVYQVVDSRRKKTPFMGCQVRKEGSCFESAGHFGHVKNLQNRQRSERCWQRPERLLLATA